MKLCFGTFAKILILCMEGMTQNKLVAKLAKCVDENSSYISNQYRYNHSFDEIDGDKPSISKLVNCKNDFSYASGGGTTPPTLNEVIEKLTFHIIPFMGEKCKTKIALTLIRVIQEDESIIGEEKDAFKGVFGYDKQQFFLQTNFLFSELLGKTLLYVVNSDIKNTKGKSCIEAITEKYIAESFDTFQFDYVWEEDCDTFTLYSYEMLVCFYKTLSSSKIDHFIGKIDPTDLFDWDFCSGKIDEFHDNIQSEISDKYNSMSKTSQKIFEFDKVLDDYIEYLAHNTRPLPEKPNIAVPIYRDDNTQWSVSFSDNVINYRKNLIHIFQEIFELLYIKIDQSSM